MTQETKEMSTESAVPENNALGIIETPQTKARKSPKKSLSTKANEVHEPVSVEAPRTKTQHERDLERDLRPITGIFKNYETPSETLVFQKRKYREEGKITTYKWKDGERVTCPFYVAQEIAEGAAVLVNERYQNTDGKVEYRVGSWIKRYDFFPIGEQVEFRKPNMLAVATRI